MNILRIDASARREQSISRRLGDEVEQRLINGRDDVRVTRRELADALPLPNDTWVRAKGTPDDKRSKELLAALELSFALIDEVKAADALIFTTPIYNYNIPAAVKAWVDLIYLPRRSFDSTARGPVGLLGDRPTYLVMASGGTRVDSDNDFATPYLRFILRGLGIEDLRLIAADGAGAEPDAALARARAAIDQHLQ